MDEENQKRWAIGILLGVLGTVATIFVSAGMWFADKQIDAVNHAEETRRHQLHEQQQIPKLRCIASRFQDGFAYFTIENSSPSQTANIAYVTLTVSDPEQLQAIARIHPRPRSNGGIGAQNHVDEILFRQGTWASDFYTYTANVGLNVPPGGATDLRLAIIEPKLGRSIVRGDLEISYSNGTQYWGSLQLADCKIPSKSDLP